MTIVAIVCIILFFIAVIAVGKTYEYGGTLEGLARINYLTSLEKEDLKKESFSDQIYVWLSNIVSPSRPKTEASEKEEEEENCPTFQEYKEWQANRPDLKTWREYSEWKLLDKEREINADDGDVEHGG